MKKTVKLKALQAEPKDGCEMLSFNEQEIAYNLLDFWRWSVSDILSNATRGRFAEFIVGTALDLDIKRLRNEWSAYDLETDTGAKIEIKSAAYIQSWSQSDYSTISFSIKPAKHWDADNGMSNDVPKRHADIYVFCLLNHKDQNTIDPLKLEQWVFFVVPTFKLDSYKRSQTSITLKSLMNMKEGVVYNKLKKEIEEAYIEQQKYETLE